MAHGSGSAGLRGGSAVSRAEGELTSFKVWKSPPVCESMRHI